MYLSQMWNQLWSSGWTANLVLPLALFCLFLFTRGPLASGLFRPLKKLGEKTGSKWPEELQFGFEKPLRILWISFGIMAAYRACPVLYGGGVGWAVLLRCFRSLLILLVAWGLYRMADSDRLMTVFLVKKFDLQIDAILFPFLSKAIRFAIGALALLIVAQEWNYSISGLLAGLGLGGLAFALAAKDMLANVFGGLVILLDKPFAMGDWIQAGDSEGTVEDMNFRSVKVRTFTQAIVTIPNTLLANEPVTNYSRMGKRKVTFRVGVRRDTEPERMKACTDGIRESLLANEGIEQDSVDVALDGIGENSLDLMISYYTRSADWKEYLKVRESAYYSVLEILKNQGAELAFPTRTLEVERPES